MVSQISAATLSDRLDGGTDGVGTADLLVVDTRPAESYEAWHVPGAANVPYDPDEGLDRETVDGVNALADSRQVVAICGKGLTSTPFAFDLEAHGYVEPVVVEGGMEAWSTVYETVEVPTTDAGLELHQVQRRANGCLGYVVGDAATGEAAVVDPTRHTDRFKVVAEEAGLTTTRVLDTHVHADHLSGGPDLADTLDVPYHLGAAARERGVRHEYEPVADGETLAVGDVTVEALHTPGHTTESTSSLVDGSYLLTGDALFVDSVGRTELEFGEAEAARGADRLYESLHETLLPLPDDTVVLPGHAPVGSDGRWDTGAPGEPHVARLGDLEARLDLLSMDRAAFVDHVVEDAPEKPANYETVLAHNLGQDTVQDERRRTELEVGPNNCAA